MQNLYANISMIFFENYFTNLLTKFLSRGFVNYLWNYA